MLEIRPNCELCDCDLPPASNNAYICTYECTFCKDCAHSILINVCPNCGGGFCQRPIRPQVDRRAGVSLEFQSASKTRVNTKYSIEEITSFSNAFLHIAPEER